MIVLTFVLGWALGTAYTFLRLQRKQTEEFQKRRLVEAQLEGFYER